MIVEGIFTQINPKATPAERLTCLLHDAAEYVIGDMISPFKTALGLDYKTFEAQIEEAVHIRFGLPPVIPTRLKKKIKACDIYCAWFEATQIAGFSIEEANKFFVPPPKGLHVKLNPEPVVAAETLFLEQFHELYSN